MQKAAAGDTSKRRRINIATQSYLNAMIKLARFSGFCCTRYDDYVKCEAISSVGRVSFRLMKKSSSILMRAIGYVLGLITPTFMNTYWTTVGRTVYTPTRNDNDENWGTATWCDTNSVLQHELVHVKQFERFPFWFVLVCYIGPAPVLLITTIVLAITLQSWLISLACLLLTLITLPLTVGLAFGRWYMEREAYLMTLSCKSIYVEKLAMLNAIVEMLWTDYAYTWPKKWMKRWFLSKI
jgi:hypothetical protein